MDISFTVVLLSLLFFVSNITSSKEGGGGQWIPLTRCEIESKDMVALANYTVSEHNKEKKKDLVFEKLYSGYKQVASGLNKYNLSETATDYDHCTTPIGSCEGTHGNYTAVVWVHALKNFTQLVSFKKIK
ncbi:Cysteine proteinase inhibitor 5 [Striga hermonthica]|uniref:Cysteine proteinase inhibitor 5 n=1 Tax=Striga hermonthica TaxID=68872 RepID=A0A9N7R6Z1_STRHE|nr:Cysteine proteinase inhibitor 5 [Striga hermonthica]